VLDADGGQVVSDVEIERRFLGVRGVAEDLENEAVEGKVGDLEGAVVGRPGHVGLEAEDRVEGGGGLQVGDAEGEVVGAEHGVSYC
jgi:hypothetical protein